MRREQWRRLTLYREEQTTVSTQTFDSPIRLDDGWQYDGKSINRRYSYKLPPELRSIAILTDNPAVTLVTLVAGADFQVENGYLFTDLDFFAVPELVKTTEAVFDASRQAVQIWGFGCQSDMDDMFQQFGYIAGIKKPSSAAYNRLVNAYFDCLTTGSTEDSIHELLAACLDAPRSQFAGEKVLYKYFTQLGAVCVTDHSVYRCKPGNLLTVNVGDVLEKGQYLTDAIVVHQSLTAADLPTFAIPPNWLATCFKEPVFLENTAVPLKIDTAGSLTKVTWDMPGNPVLAEAFFDYIHTAGIVETQKSIDCEPETEIVRLPTVAYHRGTLAHRLDSRTILRSEPTPTTLPSTINPYQLFATSVLNANIRIIRLKPWSDEFLFADVLQRIGSLLPLGVGVVFVLEFEKQTTAIGPTDVQTDFTFASVLSSLATTLSPADVSIGPIQFRIL
jgi:hypothetical protein